MFIYDSNKYLFHRYFYLYTYILTLYYPDFHSHAEKNNERANLTANTIMFLSLSFFLIIGYRMTNPINLAQCSSRSR